MLAYSDAGRAQRGITDQVTLAHHIDNPAILRRVRDRHGCNSFVTLWIELLPERRRVGHPELAKPRQHAAAHEPEALHDIGRLDVSLRGRNRAIPYWQSARRSPLFMTYLPVPFAPL